MTAWEPVIDPDVDAAFAAARKSLAWPDFNGLLDLGVPRDITGRMPTDGGLALGADDISVKDGRWQRQFRGERAIVLPVWSPYGDLFDLVAFRLETPRSFWTMTGEGWVLGYDDLDRAEFMGTDGEPLTIHESPLDWLKAGCEGIVILDWKRLWSGYLTRAPALKFNDAGFARRATALFQRPFPIPPILVPAA